MRTPSGPPAPTHEVVVEAHEWLTGRAVRTPARVDFLYDKECGQVHVNELDTLPGFTAHSMYPKVWAASGVSYRELITRMIDLGLERYERYSRKGRTA